MNANMATQTKERKNHAKKRGTDIPLDNIPDRVTRQQYSDETKLEAVKRVKAGEAVSAVAKAMGIPSDSVIFGWIKRVDAGLPVTNRNGPRPGKSAAPEISDVAAALKTGLARANKARNERLEAAALIVEHDGGTSESAKLAKQIRALKREQTAAF